MTTQMGLTTEEADVRIFSNDIPNGDFINETVSKDKHELFFDYKVHKAPRHHELKDNLNLQKSTAQDSDI